MCLKRMSERVVGWLHSRTRLWTGWKLLRSRRCHATALNKRSYLSARKHHARQPQPRENRRGDERFPGRSGSCTAHLITLPSPPSAPALCRHYHAASPPSSSSSPSFPPPAQGRKAVAPLTTTRRARSSQLQQPAGARGCVAFAWLLAALRPRHRASFACVRAWLSRSSDPSDPLPSPFAGGTDSRRLLALSLSALFPGLRGEERRPRLSWRTE